LKFLFYVIFFAIVLTYYGMPINLFREVYVSFQALKQRLVAFAKYRRLMANMNRFESVTEEELDDAGHDCIICRDDMTVNDCKKLPGCGHVFHKSCLREWLVQQQSCPTCRGDITAMQAEATRRAAAEARAAEAAQQLQEEQAHHDDDHDHDNEPRTEEAQESQPSTTKSLAGDVEREPVRQVTAANRNYNAAPQQHVLRAPVPIEEQSPFPALYRVVKDEGAQVWDESHQFVSRTVPFGVVVLCQTLQWKQEVGFMMQLPDGWVHEDTVVRVRTLASLKNAAQQKQKRQ
jgi:Ring finger domain